MAAKSSLTQKIAGINNLISKDKKEHGLAVVFFLWVKGEKWYSVNAMLCTCAWDLLCCGYKGKQRQTQCLD